MEEGFGRSDLFTGWRRFQVVDDGGVMDREGACTEAELPKYVVPPISRAKMETILKTV